LKFKLKRHDSSIINCAIDYHRSVIDYQRGNFKNNSVKSHPFMSFWKATKGLYIYDLCSKIFRVFQNFIVLFFQKQTFGQTLAKQLRILLSSSNCIILLLKRERNFCSSEANCGCNQEVVGLLICKFFLTRGKGIPRRLRSCKGIYKDSGNLKWIAWGLDVGTVSGRTSINWVCNSLFPNLIYIIAI